MTDRFANRFFIVEGNTLRELCDNMNSLGIDYVYARCISVAKEGKVYRALFDMAVTLVVSPDMMLDNNSEEESPYQCMCTESTTCYECMRRQFGDDMRKNTIKLVD